FLDNIGTDASQGDKAGGDIQPTPSKPEPRDETLAVSDEAFMTMLDKQRPPAPQPIKPHFDPGVSAAEVVVEGETHEMGLAEPQRQLPKAVVKAEAVDFPVGEIVD